MNTTSEYRFDWCMAPADQMMGDWYHVTDVTGEHVAHVVKLGPREWYAYAEDGTSFAGSTRIMAVRKVANR